MSLATLATEEAGKETFPAFVVGAGEEAETWQWVLGSPATNVCLTALEH